MYGYITPDNVVGQLFDKKPRLEDEVFHEKFIEAIAELPPGVTSGWRHEGGDWLPPETETEAAG